MASLPNNVGFIGLGIMGFPMAVNLASKLPSNAKLFIYDISTEALNRLQKETPKGRVQICDSSREVAEEAVRTCCSAAFSVTQY